MDHENEQAYSDPVPDDLVRTETSDERRERERREEGAAWAEGEAQLAAGQWIDEATLEAWLDRLEYEPDALVPTRQAHGPTST